MPPDENVFDKLKREIEIELGASDIENVHVRRMAHAAACRAVDLCAAEIRAAIPRSEAEGPA